MTTVSATRSPWLEGDAPAAPAAAGALTADVLVIGAGITGATTALLLARAGLDVIICEAASVASGASGLNTAKVSALQATIYSDLTKNHGAAAATAYAQASMAGVETVAELAALFAPDAGLRRRPAATVAGTLEQVDTVNAELAAAEAAGLPVRVCDQIDAPLPCYGAVCLDDQLSLHPVRYVRGLVRAAQQAGARLYENSRALSVNTGSPHRVQTADAEISARHVVVAGHYPMFDRGLYFARLEPRRSYCVGAPLADNGPETMAITAGEPTRSFAVVDGMAILGGEGHAAGDRDIRPARYERLARDLRAWYQVSDVPFRWSAQDPISIDRLPMIGPYLPGAHGLWVATGYGKWGLSTGTVAAGILTDLVMGRPNPWAQTFRPARFSLRSTPKLAKLGAKTVVDLVGDRLRAGEAPSVQAVLPGTAAVVRSGRQQMGVYRDADGIAHKVSLRCTHLGCLLRFNAAEISWDCPCHGSRFGVDGGVLEGPAVHPLETY